MICRSRAALILSYLGYPDQALEAIDRTFALARELSHPFSLAYALFFTAVSHHIRRERQLTQERAELAIALATEYGFPHWLAGGTIMRGWALADQGQEEEGIALMRQGLASMRAGNAELHRSYFLALLAEAYGKVGRTQEGVHMLTEALAQAHNTRERFHEAELHRLKGELLLRQTIPAKDHAEICFQQAIEVAQTQQAKLLELRAVMGLSRLWQKRGKQVEARQLLSEIYNWFTEGFDTADLKEAKRLLEELS